MTEFKKSKVYSNFKKGILLPGYKHMVKTIVQDMFMLNDLKTIDQIYQQMKIAGQGCRIYTHAVEGILQYNVWTLSPRRIWNDGLNILSACRTNNVNLEKNIVMFWADQADNVI